MSNIIEAEGLTKRFGTTQALDGVDLAAREGTVLGVLGPNGAGKTTAVRILATLLRADAGRATVAGYDVVKDAAAGPPHHRPDRPVRLGRRGPDRHPEPGADRPAAGPDRPGRARPGPPNCSSGSTSPTPRSAAAKTYSGGMRRRLDLAASLVGRPAVIFLDEPTTGLDPAKREDMWDVVRRLVADGSTVLLTTQYLEEADALADEITVIDHGRVIAHDTPDGLKRTIGGQRIRVKPADRDRLDDVAPHPRRRSPAHAPQVTGRDELTVRRRRRAGAGRAPSAGWPPRASRVTELSLHLPSLDEVFLTLTGRRASTDDAPTPERRTAA